MTANSRSMSFPLLRSTYPWLIVSCGMLFYCLNYFLRSSPSVIENDLLNAFHITATDFGLLAATYSVSYVFMQVPAGMIFDRFGVRLVLSFASIIATVGLCIFLFTTNVYIAGAGRFLIGLGCAFSYIGTLKLASVWLPVNRFATAAGCTTAVGMSFAIFSKKYLNHSITALDYHAALMPAVFAGLVLSLVIFFFIRDHKHHPEKPAPTMEMSEITQALKIIARNPQMWLIGIIGCLLYLPASFLDTYDIQFWQTVYHITPNQAVNVSSLLFFGWIIGGPVIGAFSDRIKRRKSPLLISGMIAAILLGILFYLPDLVTLHFLYITSFTVGFCLGSHPLCFPLGKENNPLQISGTATAVTNMLIMTGGMILPPFVGKLLDFHCTNIGSNGLPIYNANDYLFACRIIPIGVGIGIFLCFFLKETYCQQRKLKEKNKIDKLVLRNRMQETGS